MRNTEILRMLNAGQIEELKNALKDEIYKDTLKVNPSAKKRYAAMKRYFSYVNQSRECLKRPCVIEFEGEKYTSFTNSWSLVFTSEPTGEIELFDTEHGKYPDVTRLIRFDGIKKKLDFNDVLAKAKSRGYKLNKNEVSRNFKYLLLYDGTYYKIGLLDITFSIINDGKPVIAYHPDGVRMPLTIKNDIGLCMIMPVKFEDESTEDDDYVVIEVEV